MLSHQEEKSLSDVVLVKAGPKVCSYILRIYTISTKYRTSVSNTQKQQEKAKSPDHFIKTIYLAYQTV